MKKTIFATAVVSVGILFFTTGAKAGNIKEGKWSMTTVIHMDGADDQMAEAQEEMDNMSPEDKAMMQKMMGGMEMKTGGKGGGMGITSTQCLTNDNPVPEASNEDNCEQTHKIKGNTVHFEITCADSHSTGDVT